jgi:hypothetical protein
MEESMSRVRFVIPTLAAALALGMTLKHLGETEVDPGIVAAATVAGTAYTEASEHIPRKDDDAEPASTF